MGNASLPDAAKVGGVQTVGVTLTEALVRRFADFTGDVSSLHVDPAFARRSQYRRPVAHGMLPLAFLPLLAPFRRPGLRCVPSLISGRFTSPLFVGDSVEVTAAETGEGTFELRVVVPSSGTVATRGKLHATFERSLPEARTSGEQAAGLLTAAAPVRTFWFEQIEEGQEESPLSFRAGPAAMESLAALLRSATGGAGLTGSELGESFDFDFLASVLLFSTSVGVSLPGVPATFLEFQARRVAGDGSDDESVLRGRVSHRSGATSIIKKVITIAAESKPSQPRIEGSVSVLVNKPAKAMPTMAEIRAAGGLDLGLRGKVALITGASRGIGETIAKLFALAGSRVVINYFKGADDAARVAKEIVDEGGDALAVRADVTDETEVRELVRQAVERFGTVDILVNNAARDYRPIPTQQLEWDDVEADLAVIVKGALLCSQQVLPIMLERGAGKIVNISTLATEAPPPGQLKYVIAKSALDGLTRGLAAEYAAKNIQVNSVVPNFVETDLVAHVQEGFRKKIADEIPMGRLTSPIDVARAAVYLASAYSDYTTGQRVLVTGGSTPYL